MRTRDSSLEVMEWRIARWSSSGKVLSSLGAEGGSVAVKTMEGVLLGLSIECDAADHLVIFHSFESLSDTLGQWHSCQRSHFW